MACRLLVLTVALALLFLCCKADRVLKGADGNEIRFAESDDDLYQRAMEAAMGAGHTFDTLTSSYSRVLTTLVNLGFDMDDVNRITAMVAAKKGVTISSNPGRDTPEPLPWHLELPDDLSQLQDALAARGQRLSDFFDTLTFADGGSFSAAEVRRTFHVETDRSLKAMKDDFRAREAALRKSLAAASKTERDFVDGLREVTFDFQNARWATQCSVAMASFASAWREQEMPAPIDVARRDGRTSLKAAVDAAVKEALARVGRRGRAAVVTGDAAPLQDAAAPDEDIDDSVAAEEGGYLARIKTHFRSLVVAGPVAKPTSQVMHIEKEKGGRRSALDVEYSDEDITASVCGMYYSLRRIISHVGGTVTPATMDLIRRLLLHFHSSVQRESADHYAAFFDADVIVLDAMHHRLATAMVRLVYNELRRTSSSSSAAVTNTESFDRFYRSVFEESTFMLHGFERRIVRSLARDVPQGSAFIVAYPTRECRDVIYANGTEVTVECESIFSRLETHTDVLLASPFFTAEAEEVYDAAAPVVNLPMDTPTRAILPEALRASFGVAAHRLRVVYKVVARQWGEPRALSEDEAPPSFGDEMDEIIREELERERLSASVGQSSSSGLPPEAPQAATIDKDEL